MTAASFWTPVRFQTVTRGRWLVEPADARASIAGVSIDTRTLGPGEAYVAVRGERFDGHTFVPQALAAGAALAIVETDDRPAAAEPGGAVLRVESTLVALQALARAYRDELRSAGCRVIAVTGSNGKTSTRNLICHVLSGSRQGTQSPKSFNNHIGVPLTILLTKPADDFIVVEIGSNHPGEVDTLAAIVEPDAAVVTSIGHEHLEFFGTLEAVAEEEFAVLRHLAARGLAVIPTADYLPGVPTALGELGAGIETIRFEHDPAVPDDLPLLGDHNRRNAAAAAAIGRWMGLTEADITARLRTAAAMEGRLQVIRIGPADAPRLTVLNDAYNANPSSMEQALKTLGQMDIPDPTDTPGTPNAGEKRETSARRVAILADMLELGEQGPDLHRATARVLFDLEDVGRTIDHVVTIGPLSMFTAEALLRRWPGERVTTFAAWNDDLPDTIAGMLRPGDVVLLKGSRGLRLERLLPAMRARFG